MNFRRFNATVLYLLLILLTISCSTPQTIGQIGIDDATLLLRITEVLAAVQSQVAPDLRLTVFDVIPSTQSGSVTLQGKILTNEQMVGITNALNEVAGVKRLDNQVTVLPASSLGERQYGMSNEAVLNLGVKPFADSGQFLATQTILADQLLLLEEERGWLLVQMWDGYLGWVDGDSIVRMTGAEVAEYRSGAQAEVLAKVLPLFSAPDATVVIMEAVQGTVLPIGNHWGDYLELILPDGRSGWASRSSLRQYSDYHSIFTDPRGVEAVIATAGQYIGLPYLWGGTTALGFDCSGFVQYALRINGYPVLRDTNQQYLQGEEVDRAHLHRGDIVYFSTYRAGPSHMGIYLGSGEYIHAASSSGVAIHSLDPSAANYNADLDSKYIGARRVSK